MSLQMQSHTKLLENLFVSIAECGECYEILGMMVLSQLFFLLLVWSFSQF